MRTRTLHLRSPRVAVVADIHGNAAALEAALEVIGEEGITDVVAAGDHFTGGPEAARTLELLQRRDLPCLRGNTDERVLDCLEGRRPPELLRKKHWQRTTVLMDELGGTATAFLRALPDHLLLSFRDLPPIRVVHGSPASAHEHILPGEGTHVLEAFQNSGLIGGAHSATSVEKACSMIAETVLLCGHTHVPWKWRTGGKFAANVGSVGAPNHGDWRAHFAVVSWSEGGWEVQPRMAAYDVDRVVELMASSQLGQEREPSTLCYMYGVKYGLPVLGHFSRHAYAIAERRGCSDFAQAIPDEIWDEASATFNWDAASRGELPDCGIGHILTQAGAVL